MMSTPLVSVIVPVYNVALYLPRCLDSIIQQTYKNLEIILVDDGSTDNCPQICDQYAAKDPRVKVLHQQNKGVSAARNAGLDNAHGEFITFVDPDDWLPLNAMEQYLQAAQRNQADLVWAGYTLVYKNKSPKQICHSQISTFLTPHAFAEAMCRYGDFGVCNKFFRRALVAQSRFQSQYKQGEDLSFLFLLLPKIQRVAFVNQSLYFYFQRDDSAQHLGNLSTQQHNQEIGQALYDTCKQCHFHQALPYAKSVLLLSTALYGSYILLQDKSNHYAAQLQQVVSLFQQHRKFIFNNKIMWQPAKFCIQIWSLFPALTKWFCRLPGINPLLQKMLIKKMNRPK